MNKKKLNQFDYFDIESLDNLFSIVIYHSDPTAIKEKTKDGKYIEEIGDTSIDVYYLIDDENIKDEIKRNRNFKKDLVRKIKESNYNFRGKTYLYDLKDNRNVIRLAKYFGITTAFNPFDKNDEKGDIFLNKFRKNFNYQTDPEYDEYKDPFILSYNGYNYDITMLAMYFNMVMFRQANSDKIRFNKVSAKDIRQANNALFDKHFINRMSDRLLYNGSNIMSNEEINASRKNYRDPRYKMRQNMLRSNRFVDVARLNEKMQRIGLKRLLGMLGFQILESEKTFSKSYLESLDDFYDVIAYNVSDVVNLELLFNHSMYKSSFVNKKTMINTYKELVYERDESIDELKAKEDINSVKFRRETIDSTSAQLTTSLINPYPKETNLVDIPYVNFTYPSKRVAREKGIKQINVLEFIKDFFYKNIKNEDARKEFDVFYNMYKNIENKNVNLSRKHVNYYTDYYNKMFHEDKQKIMEENQDIYDFNTSLNENKTKNEKELIKLNKEEEEKKKLKENLDLTEEELKGISYYDVIGVNKIIKEKNEEIRRSNKNKKNSKKDYLIMLKTYPQKGYHVGKRKPNTSINIKNYENIKETKFNMFYYDKDGNKTSCYITISIGGVHGAEINIYYLNDVKDRYHKELNLLEKAKKLVNNDPVKLRKQKEIKIDGKKYKYNKFLKSGRKIEDSEFKDLDRLDIDVFDKDDKLNNKLTFTSAGFVNHNDFASYYPLLLNNLSAFTENRDRKRKNERKDVYYDQFIKKEKYGKLMKDPTIEDLMRAYYADLRGGVKLVLNAASGAGSTDYDNNIRMNNMILSMRMIGQMFTYYIGQKQALEGAVVPSTNTDGLYTILDSKLNDDILKESETQINVDIEPERMFLISKDSNSRIELTEDLETILSTSSDLGCAFGPNPNYSLDHPAIRDYIVARYMQEISKRCIKNMEDKGYDKRSKEVYEALKEEFIKPFDLKIGYEIIKETKEFESFHFLNMYQNVISASVDKDTYAYVYRNSPNDWITTIRPLSHYSRIFIIKDDPNGKEYNMRIKKAAKRKLTPQQKKKRLEEFGDANYIDHDDIAMSVLNHFGIYAKDIPNTHEANTQKVSNVDEDWNIGVINKSLNNLNKKEIENIRSHLDYDKYLKMAADHFNKNWKNRSIKDKKIYYKEFDVKEDNNRKEGYKEWVIKQLSKI